MGNHNEASLASLSCFSQNSKAFNVSSNENMTLKLNLITHLTQFFSVFNFFFGSSHFKLFKIARRPFMNMVYTNITSYFLGGAGHSPKFDPSAVGGGGGCAQYRAVQYVYLVPADTHVYFPA